MQTAAKPQPISCGSQHLLGQPVRDSALFVQVISSLSFFGSTQQTTLATRQFLRILQNILGVSYHDHKICPKGSMTHNGPTIGDDTAVEMPHRC